MSLLRGTLLKAILIGNLLRIQLPPVVVIPGYTSALIFSEALNGGLAVLFFEDF